MSEETLGIVLTSFGGYDKLVLKNIERKPLEGNEVCIRIRSCGMNFSDLLTRQGFYTLGGMKPPFVLGLECSGIVEAVGDTITELQVGDRVMCWSFRYGMWSETVNVPSNNCLRIPDSMSFNDAAALPINYTTAYFAILDFAHLRPHQSVLIQCAAGGVGCAATQIAHTVDDVTVFGTSSASKHDVIRKNGVDHPIDYKSKNFVEALKEITPEGVDVVLDCLGGSDFVQAQTILKPMGRVVSIGVSNVMAGEKRSIYESIKVWWKTKNVSMSDMLTNSTSVCGVNMATIMEKSPERFRDAMKELVRLYEAGKIKPQIDLVLEFSQVVEGTKRLTERKNIGKVILVPKGDQ